MNEQVVSIGFGKANYTDHSASLTSFIVEPPFVRTLPSKALPRQGQCQRFPVSAHPEINGYLYLDTVKAPDGIIMMLQNSHRSGASSIRDGAIFLALRSEGPMLSIRATLPSSIGSTIGTEFLVFQGRADRIDPLLQTHRPFDIPKNWANAYLDPEEISECYRISEMASALSTKPEFEIVETVEGETVAVPKKAHRSIRLRRAVD